MHYCTGVPLDSNVTVETEVGVNASTGVGINGRWDY
jgi:hypothetical protein